MANNKSSDVVASPIVKFGIIFIFIAAIILIAYVAKNFYWKELSLYGSI